MNISEERVLIAGGTGLIGKDLVKKLRAKGAEVRVLTRKPANSDEFYWNPDKKEINENALVGITVLINLSGAGIADKRWTSSRKQELEDSRVGANRFLFSLHEKLPELKHFICASGINAYTPNHPEIFNEESPFGSEFLCELTRKWEESALLFSSFTRVSLVRTAVVLAPKGGAYPKLAGITKWGLDSGLGTGKQYIPWIHLDDLSSVYIHLLEHELAGVFNGVAGCETNHLFMKKLAKSLHKPFFLPNVPGWLLKLILGEMATMLLDGVHVSNQKLHESNFKFNFQDLNTAFDSLKLQ